MRLLILRILLTVRKCEDEVLEEEVEKIVLSSIPEHVAGSFNIDSIAGDAQGAFQGDANFIVDTVLNHVVDSVSNHVEGPISDQFVGASSPAAIAMPSTRSGSGQKRNRKGKKAQQGRGTQVAASPFVVDSVSNRGVRSDRVASSRSSSSHIQLGKKGKNSKSKGKGGGGKGYWAGDARYDIEDRRRAETMVHQWQFGLGMFDSNARRAAVLASWPEDVRRFLYNILADMLRTSPPDTEKETRVIVSIQSTIERLADGMDVEEVSKLMEDDMAISSSDEDLNIGQIGMD